MTGRPLLVASAARARRFFDDVGAAFSRQGAWHPSDCGGTSGAVIARYKKIIDLASVQAKIGVWQCDLASNTLTWTDGVYALFDLPARSKITRARSLEFYHPDSRARMEILRARAIEERTSFSLDARITTAKGAERWMRLTGNVECENGKAVRLFGMKQDMTQEKQLLERLRLLAETDLLTGLANRAQVQARLDACADRGMPSALLLVDLDGFKRINDTLGHLAGDECLRQVALRLRRACGSTALIARLGGDEFAIVVEAGVSRLEVMDLVAVLIADLRQPIGWDRHAINLSGSIGVTLPHADQDAATLLTEADLALYAAKAAGRNAYRVFAPGMRSRTEARSTTELQFDLFSDLTADRREAIASTAA